MDKKNWVSKLFQAVDKMDTEAFVAFLSDDVLFRFGNAEPVNGKALTGEIVGGFFGSIKGLSHDLAAIWEEEDAVICHGTVTYTRHDSTTLCLPFANILGISDNLINEYRIFIDISELYGKA